MEDSFILKFEISDHERCSLAHAFYFSKQEFQACLADAQTRHDDDEIEFYRNRVEDLEVLEAKLMGPVNYEPIAV